MKQPDLHHALWLEETHGGWKHACRSQSPQKRNVLVLLRCRKKYEGTRGFLTNKVYQGTNGPGYTYTKAGRLATRLWARGTNTTYTYNNFGDLSGVSYNDGATPTLSYTYTRRGQQDKVTRGSDAWRLFYTTAGQLLSEAGTAGTLNGLRVTNAFDAYLRRTNVSSANGATVLTTNGYTFDTAGRLSTARDGTFVATYSYLANSPLVSQIEFKSNTTVRLTTTKSYDNLNRLTSIASLGTGSTPSVISRQPTARRVPPVLKTTPEQLLKVRGLATRQVRPLLLFIRAFQRKGHPHHPLSRSASGASWREAGFGASQRRQLCSARQKVPANRVRNATASGFV